MKRLNGGSVPKLQFTTEEWFLAAMPMKMPNGSQVDFTKLGPEEYVPMPIKATEQGVREVLGYISLAADVYGALSQNSEVDSKIATDAANRLYRLDGFGAQLIRGAGFDIDVFLDSGELIRPEDEQAA